MSLFNKSCQEPRISELSAPAAGTWLVLSEVATMASDFQGRHTSTAAPVVAPVATTCTGQEANIRRRMVQVPRKTGLSLTIGLSCPLEPSFLQQHIAAS